MLIVCKLQICNCKSSWKASSNQRGDNLARNHSALSSFQVIRVHAHGNRAPLTWCMFVSLTASLDKLWLTDLYFRWGKEVLMPFHKETPSPWALPTPISERCSQTETEEKISYREPVKTSSSAWFLRCDGSGEMLTQWSRKFLFPHPTIHVRC